MVVKLCTIRTAKVQNTHDNLHHHPVTKPPPHHHPTPLSPPGAAPSATASTHPPPVSPEKTAHTALAHLLENGRQFCIATAKAVHTPVRRREEPFTQPTQPMAVASASLALLLRDGLAMRVLPAAAHLPTHLEGMRDASEEQVHTWMRYVGRWLDLVNSTLLDPRRRTCHTLVLNYLCRAGGLVALTNMLRCCAWAYRCGLDKETGSETPHKEAPSMCCCFGWCFGWCFGGGGGGYIRVT